MPRVFSLEAAEWTVMLATPSTELRTMFGKTATPKRKTIAAIVQQELMNALSKVTAFANDHVAHRRVAATNQPIRFHDLRESLAAAFSVFNWCALLIEASTWTSAVPTIQTNWTKVFRAAWLPKEGPLPSYKHLDEFIRAQR